MTPSPHKVHKPIRRIIFRVNVKVSDFLDVAASRIARDATDVVHAKACCVVGLIDETVVDILIVVDGFLLGLVEAGVDRLFEIADVEDVGDGELLSCGTGAVFFFEFVIKDKVFLPIAIEDGALVGVRGTDVGSA